MRRGARKSIAVYRAMACLFRLLIEALTSDFKTQAGDSDSGGACDVACPFPLPDVERKSAGLGQRDVHSCLSYTLRGAPDGRKWRLLYARKVRGLEERIFGRRLRGLLFSELDLGRDDCGRRPQRSRYVSAGVGNRQLVPCAAAFPVFHGGLFLFLGRPHHLLH